MTALLRYYLPAQSAPKLPSVSMRYREAADFGDEFTPELREQEERLRAEVVWKAQA